MNKYTIMLSKNERIQLKKIISSGIHDAHKTRTAYVLLNCDEGKFGNKSSNELICEILKIGMRTIDRIKKKHIEEGFEESLNRRPSTRNYKYLIDTKTSAKLMKLYRKNTPAGYSKWTYRLLAEQMIQLKFVEHISHVTIRNFILKNEINNKN